MIALSQMVVEARCDITILNTFIDDPVGVSPRSSGNQVPAT
ncbi:hypothetical protein OG943_09605 [Amycolatopsis sp. NBC_00345]